MGGEVGDRKGGGKSLPFQLRDFPPHSDLENHSNSRIQGEMLLLLLFFDVGEFCFDVGDVGELLLLLFFDVGEFCFDVGDVGELLLLLFFDVGEFCFDVGELPMYQVQQRQNLRVHDDDDVVVVLVGSWWVERCCCSLGGEDSSARGGYC